jgi:UDP-N-acetyl-D-mannosaminuronic acid transferase (WecB/TagA/CpsF family)
MQCIILALPPLIWSTAEFVASINIKQKKGSNHLDSVVVTRYESLVLLEQEHHVETIYHRPSCTARPSYPLGQAINFLRQRTELQNWKTSLRTHCVL